VAGGDRHAGVLRRVISDPDGDAVASPRAESGFVIDVETGGLFSLISSGCGLVRAVLD
jgi:hypothetical protein